MSSTANPLAIDGFANAPREVDGGTLLVRGAQRVTGTALVFASLGIWLVPFVSWEPDLALMKLLISLALGFAGIAFLQEGRTSVVPELELDLSREEVRVIRRNGSRARLVVRYRFSDLVPAEEIDGAIRLRDPEGGFLADVALEQASLRKSLLSKLPQA